MESVQPDVNDPNISLKQQKIKEMENEQIKLENERRIWHERHDQRARELKRQIKVNHAVLNRNEWQRLKFYIILVSRRRRSDSSKTADNRSLEQTIGAIQSTTTNNLTKFFGRNGTSSARFNWTTEFRQHLLYE